MSSRTRADFDEPYNFWPNSRQLIKGGFVAGTVKVGERCAIFLAITLKRGGFDRGWVAWGGGATADKHENVEFIKRGFPNTNEFSAQSERERGGGGGDGERLGGDMFK